MKHITVNTYQKDKYYPRVVRAVEKILARADVVAPSDILIEMGNLSKKNYEAWRKGQVPYLEQVFEGSLSKANRILRIIGFHAHDLNMVPRQTAYHQWGESKLDKPFARVELHQGVLDSPDLDSDIFNGVRIWELPF